MGREFPHLNKANAWPGLRTVAPFDLQVTFDPYLWTPDVTIHLCSTPLDPEYEHIGGWRNQQERDAWFNDMSDRELTLDTEMHVLPGVEIKLPYAFEILQGYDHLFIDFPPTPTSDGSTATHRYYYFLSDVQYRSPSATACIITLDEWSTHMFDLDMRYIELERGHAPMAATSVDDYLRNPLANCRNLTVPDENYGGTRPQLKFTAWDTVNAGPHWLVFCMTSDPEQDPGTYGHRENWRVPTTSAYRVEGAMSSLAVFAIEPSDANTLINKINEDAPQLLPTVQAVFLVPKRMVTEGTSFTFMTVSCREIAPQQTLTELITLNRAMFRYPDEYADIAKLYTMPYAWIELTDETGRTKTLAVEETTGRLDISYIASILAPFIGIDAYVKGIGSNNHDTLTWDNMAGHTFEAWGDWTAGLRHWNIPTYMVIQNSERAFEWMNHWPRVQANAMNEAGYDLGIANNNLNYSLRGAGLDRQVARLAEQQAQDSSQLTLSHACDWDVQNIMAGESADFANDDIAYARTISALTNEGYALSSSNASSMAYYENAQNKIALGLAHDYQDYVGLEGGLNVATAGVNFVGNVAQNATSMNDLDNMLLGRTDQLAVQTIQDGITDGINVASAVNSMNYGNASANASVAQAQLTLWGAKQAQKNIQATYTLQMTQNAAAQTAQENLIANKLQHGLQASNDKLRTTHQLDTDSLALQQSTQTTINNGDVAVARAQAGSIKGMSDLSITTRKNLQDESLANAQRLGRLGTPKLYAQPTGGLTNYTRPQILMARILTQDAGAIAAAGDAMLRYGYRMGGREWKLDDLTPMRNFTYWEGRVRLGTGHVNAVTRDIVSQIFMNGTTIWKDPSKIGTTSIYENRGQ